MIFCLKWEIRKKDRLPQHSFDRKAGVLYQVLSTMYQDLGIKKQIARTLSRSNYVGQRLLESIGIVD
jgi:hypothetical protein